MKSASVIKKLFAGFLILLFLLACVGFAGWRNASRMEAQFERLYEENLQASTSLSNAERGMWELRFGVANFITAPPERRAEIRREQPKWTTAIESNLQSYKAIRRSASELEALKEWEQWYPKYLEARAHWFELMEAGKTEEAVVYRAQNTNRFAASAVSALARLIDAQREVGAQRRRQAQAESRATGMIFTIIACVALLVGGAVLLLVRRVDGTLRGIAAELSEGSARVAGAAGEVSSSAQALAQGASEQAAFLEETTSSVNEVNSMTRKSADSSNHAAEVMTRTATRIAEGNQKLEHMLRSMQEINASSEKISKIIKVIDEIAFQTNILALNAAVEAARAGEAGMGFAVVADEVRNLAQRSAQAAKDTAELIEESIGKTNDGHQKVGEVAKAMTAITEDSGQVKDLIDEVSSVNQQQARGLLQISKAIAQLEQVTQKNAAGAEQGAAAGEQLNSQSQGLHGLVGRLTAIVGAN